MASRAAGRRPHRGELAEGTSVSQASADDRVERSLTVLDQARDALRRSRGRIDRTQAAVEASEKRAARMQPGVPAQPA